MHARTHARTRTHTHTHTHTPRVRAHTHTHNTHTRAHTHIHTHARARARTHAHTHTHTHTHKITSEEGWSTAREEEETERREGCCHASPDNFNRIYPLIKTYVRIQRYCISRGRPLRARPRLIFAIRVYANETVNDCIALMAVELSSSELSKFYEIPAAETRRPYPKRSVTRYYSWYRESRLISNHVRLRGRDSWFPLIVPDRL